MRPLTFDEATTLIGLGITLASIVGPIVGRAASDGIDKLRAWNEARKTMRDCEAEYEELVLRYNPETDSFVY